MMRKAQLAIGSIYLNLKIKPAEVLSVKDLHYVEMTSMMIQPSFAEEYYNHQYIFYDNPAYTYCYFWKNMLHQASKRIHMDKYKSERYSELQSNATNNMIQLNFKSGGMKFHTVDHKPIETLAGMQISIPNGVEFKLTT